MSRYGIAVYAGSFDPITLGHESLIERAAMMFEKVIVGVGVNSAKKPMLDLDTRMRLIRAIVEPFKNVEVESFNDLLVHYCERRGAGVIVRGLRTVTDFEYEIAIAQANADQSPGIETIFLPTAPKHCFVSSSVVRELARHGGDLRSYVRPQVERALLGALNIGTAK